MQAYFVVYNVFMDALQEIAQSVLSASSDVVVLGAIFAIATSYGLFFGKGRAVSLILALYPTALIFELIPYFKDILGTVSETSGDVLVKAVIFAIILLPLHFIINHFIFTDFSFSRIRKLFEAGILGLSVLALLIAFSYRVIDISELYNFSSGIDTLFASANFFWWLLAPFVVLTFLRK